MLERTSQIHRCPDRCVSEHSFDLPMTSCGVMGAQRSSRWGHRGRTRQESTMETMQQAVNEPPITMRQLLEAGVHFGHQTKRWNPKMRPFIFGARNGIHIIDLQHTVRLFNRAYNFVVQTVANGDSVLFVGTKKQAQDVVREESTRSGQFYVTNRWLGGTL